jgi:hypothetical protein
VVCRNVNLVFSTHCRNALEVAAETRDESVEAIPSKVTAPRPK